MQTYYRNNNEIVLCKEFSSETEARIAEAALQQEGIICVVEDSIFSRIYPIGIFNSQRLMVKSQDLERANQIIDSLKLETDNY